MIEEKEESQPLALVVLLVLLAVVVGIGYVNQIDLFPQGPLLIVVLPLISALLIGMVALYDSDMAWPLFIVALFAVVLHSVFTLLRVLRGVKDESGELIHELHYHLSGWDPPFGIEFVIDPFNGMVLVIIAVVAFLTAIHSWRSARVEIGRHFPQFLGLYLLLVSGLLGMTITGDVFNLYVFLEISALSMYALIALSGGRAYLATFHYLVMGSIGACFYLLGVGYLYIKTGSLNMADLAAILQNSADLQGSRAIFVAFLFIMLGMWIKMALFPLHGWLPNAYTYAPNSVSCLIAPLSTKVSVYVMIRLMLSVFGWEYAFENVDWNFALVTLSSIGIVAGSLFAFGQKNLKKMFAYIIVAEVGYMVGGVWLGNRMGITGAGFHILNDAMMTLCLFLFVSTVVYKTGGPALENVSGLFGRMPFTMAAFVIAALSMIGVPPTCGFFSKWYLILGAIEAGQYQFVAALVFSSLVNAALFFRIFEYAHFGAKPKEADAHGHEEHGHAEEVAVKIDEAPLSMLVPMYLAALSLIIIGVLSHSIVKTVVEKGLPL